MSYKEKITALEHKAHYQNIATKILKEMTELRSSIETSPNTRKRWIWELLQNAKDVHNGSGVKIEIERGDKGNGRYLLFKHDGKPFSADNIRFLIEQISSKERKRDSEGKRLQTGKFGTGFLTTHMLSEKVAVKGVVKEDGLDYKEFKFFLDRSGNDLDEIIEAVEKAKDAISNLDDLPNYTEYDESKFNTKFLYPLVDNLSEELAAQGIEDLINSLPITLCFVEEIKELEVKDMGRSFTITEKITLDSTSKLFLTTISIKDYGRPFQNVQIVTLTEGFTSIALPVIELDGHIEVSPIPFNVPKIFCDFPLIGTESFPFPVIVNNSNFNPTDPRDGVYLTETPRPNPLIDENKAIFEDAVKLYFKLLEYAITNDWSNLHLLAKLGSLKDSSAKQTSAEWFSKEVEIPLHQKLSISKIVTNAKGDLSQILLEDNKKNIWFPSGTTKVIREKIWSTAELIFPHILPEKSTIEFWAFNLWKDCGRLTLNQFASFIANYGGIEELNRQLQNIDAIAWLNMFYDLIKLDENENVTILDSKLIVPNQHGILDKKSKLIMQEGEIRKEFKDILTLLDDDIRARLVMEGISLTYEPHEFYNQSDAVKDIISEISSKANDRSIADKYRPAFRLMLQYFAENKAEAKSLFPNIYSNKHILYDDDEIMDNVNKAEELKDLLVTFNVSSADELRRKFESMSGNTKSLLPITEEILASMGITSVAEWEEAMRDTDLQSLFDHKSVPTTDMYVLSQTHISKARKRVIEYLNTLEDYDLREFDESTATTILANVKKGGRVIKIVFRPAYNKEVIIYYGAERDTLDYADSELWVDDGKDVWQVSLGHILKKNDIKKFPI